MDEFAYTVESLRRQVAKALERLDPEQRLYVTEWLQAKLEQGKRSEADNLHTALFLATSQVTKEKK